MKEIRILHKSIILKNTLPSSYKYKSIKTDFHLIINNLKYCSYKTLSFTNFNSTLRKCPNNNFSSLQFSEVINSNNCVKILNKSCKFSTSSSSSSSASNSFSSSSTDHSGSDTPSNQQFSNNTNNSKNNSSSSINNNKNSINTELSESIKKSNLSISSLENEIKKNINDSENKSDIKEEVGSNDYANNSFREKNLFSEFKSDSSISFSILDKTLSLCLTELKLLFGSKYSYKIGLFRWLKNWFTTDLLKHLSPNYFPSKYFKNDALKGSSDAFLFIFDKLSNKEYTALESCVEANLLKKLISINTSAYEHGYTIDMKINNIISTALYGINIIFGIQRGSIIHQNLKQLHVIFGQHIISSVTSGEDAPPLKFVLKAPDSPIALPQNPQQEVKSTIAFNSSIKQPSLTEALSIGGPVHMDIICKTKQIIKLSKIEKADEFYEFPENVQHHLRFEMNLNPTEEFKNGSSSPRYEGNTWKLIDFNNIMKGNYPIDYNLLKNVVGNDEK